MLETLPEEILLRVVSYLGEPIEESLTTLPCVCHAWSEALASNKHRFWIGLAEMFDLLPAAWTNSQNNPSKRRRIARKTRLQSNPKRYFYTRKQESDEKYRLEADKLVWDIWKRLRKHDCVTWVQKQISIFDYGNNNKLSMRNSISIAHHRVRGLENRNLLMLACWFGRVRVVQMLLDENLYQVSMYTLDDCNASPLLIAAWAGHDAVVKVLLSKLKQRQKEEEKDVDGEKVINYLKIQGIPPLTSSCGGRGPKTAICWAERKGFQNIVRLLEKAGASTTHRQLGTTTTTDNDDYDDDE